MRPAVASWDEPIVEYFKDTIELVFDNCIQPSVASLTQIIANLITYNVLFIILTQTGLIRNTYHHLISFILGIALLWNITSPVKFGIFISFLFSSYAVVYAYRRLCKGEKLSAATLSMAVLFISPLLCEFFFPYAQKWLEIRGVIMIVIMKAVSLSQDYDKSRCLPTLLEYLGYVCCPANCVFGPWISFADYCSVFKKPHKKNIWWFLRIVTSLTLAVFFLTVSNCWSYYFLEDENKWIQAFRMALTFRTSHYFVSYLSEMGMIIAGYKDDKCPPNEWRYKIVNPLKIELPSSLVSVVTNWNIPMHMFLKKYIFRKFLPLGKFYAIIGTYFASSLLHGFNLEIAVVLLSIGVFSYIQLHFRNKLSEDLNACVQVRACKQCNHENKTDSSVVIILSLIFCTSAILHLTYLGQIMDAIDNPSSTTILEKWENLHYCSHLIMFFSYLYCLS